MVSHPKKATVSAKRRYEDFAAFLQQNRNSALADRNLGECAVAFLIHRQKVKSLKASSCKQYGSELRSQCFFQARELGITITGFDLLSRFIDEMEVLAMHEPTAHALDVDDEDTALYISELVLEEPSTAVLIWLIAITSARPEDLLNVQSFVMDFRRSVVRVDYGPTKNRKKSSLQFTSTYIIPEVFFPTPVLKELLKSVKKGKDVHGRVMATNDVLKKTPMPGYPRVQEGRKRHPTTFSFRRLAIQRFIEEHTDDSGFVDYDKVIRKSGHLDMTMPANVYSKKAAEVIASGENAELN